MGNRHYAGSHSPKRPVIISDDPVEKETEGEEVINQAQQNRRVQQILKRKEFDLAKNEENQLYQRREISLSAKELELNQMRGEVDHQIKINEVQKSELALGWKELKHAYSLKAFELQKTLHHIKTQMEQLRLSRITFKLQEQQESLKIYAQKLALTEQYIRQMFTIRMAHLTIQKKENRIDYREQQLNLQTLFKETQSKIRELRLTRIENDLIFDKKELERRWSIINYIEDMWYYNSGMPIERNMLEHYYKAGFVPDSPLIAENQYLMQKIESLERQLLGDGNTE